MKKLNFQQFSKYAGISKTKKEIIDAREGFADLICNRVSGIRAYALALKIFQSEGDTEYSGEEIEMIRRVAEEYCLPVFIVGLYEQLGIVFHVNKEGE